MRNYAVLNIVAENARIFLTKERALLYLQIEAYRPMEITLNYPNELEQSLEF